MKSWVGNKTILYLLTVINFILSAFTYYLHMNSMVCIVWFGLSLVLCLILLISEETINV